MADAISSGRPMRPSGVIPEKRARAIGFSLKDFRPAVLLPDIEINAGPDDFRPIEHMRLVQFNGSIWQQIGDVIETAFSDTPRRHE
jgi:hypothetical protein